MATASAKNRGFPMALYAAPFPIVSTGVASIFPFSQAGIRFHQAVLRIPSNICSAAFRSDGNNSSVMNSDFPSPIMVI